MQKLNFLLNLLLKFEKIKNVHQWPLMFLTSYAYNFDAIAHAGAPLGVE